MGGVVRGSQVRRTWEHELMNMDNIAWRNFETFHVMTSLKMLLIELNMCGSMALQKICQVERRANNNAQADGSGKCAITEPNIRDCALRSKTGLEQ